MPQLIVIPTPIGNLDDLSDRARTALKDCDLLLVEDSRQTGKLLNLLGIENKMVPHHQFNEHQKLDHFIDIIQQNNSVGLVTDAGTPAISDPGFLLIRECIENEVDVECLPGPTAFVPALVISGLPCDRFCFEGFLPVKKGRQKRLTELEEETRTMVFYESPHRIARTLKDFVDHFGSERRVSVSREISKKFEETRRGEVGEVASQYREGKSKGEFVIVVEGSNG